MEISRRQVLAGAVAGAAAALGGRPARATARPTVTVWKEPT